jgi:Co/Zn/Cd efflux system component
MGKSTACHRVTDPHSYDRYELLIGFASGTLLVFVSLYVLFEGFEHILEPHEVNT